VRLKRPVAVLIAALALTAIGAWSLCALGVAAPWCGAVPRFTIEGLRTLVVESGHWGVLVSIGLMVLHSLVPLPSELITLTNGLAYGVLWGTAISWAGAMLGAFLAFGLSRSLGQGYVLKYFERKHLAEFQRIVDTYGPEAIFLCRFIPVVSFNLLNYVAGLTRMSWWTFTWTTGLGILPITVLVVVMGSRIHQLPLWTWGALALGGVLLWWGAHRIYARLKTPPPITPRPRPDHAPRPREGH
jgi:uncharacterized membrane protein YdjX (TVP38/TMEM64 family)